MSKWVHNPAIADRYNIDTENIFLVGHSMGGQTVLNAAKELPFIKGVVAMAAYDIGAAFDYKMEKDLFLMIETEGQCLKMTSVSDVYENASDNRQQLSVVNDYEKLVDHNVLLVEAALDTIAPPDKMLKPLANYLKAAGGKIDYEIIKSNHSFVGQRMKLAQTVGKWLEEHT